MGFKTTNYEIKKLGQTIPEAYAMLYKTHQEHNSIAATFAIQSSRENIDKLEPLETRKIHVVWDRKTPIQEAIYNAAKTRTIEYVDEETGEQVSYEIKGIFDGWEDDIVVEEELDVNEDTNQIEEELDTNVIV